MSNHFHLVVETPKPNLVAGMKWLRVPTPPASIGGTSSLAICSLAANKALFVDGSGTGYLKSACDYVHLNPVWAKLLRRSQRLREFRWSSFAEYLKSPSARLGWLRTERLLGEHGIQKDSPAGRAEFEKRLELRRASEELKHEEELMGGWYLGSEEFRQELLEQMSERKGAEHYEAEIRESATENAERLVRGERAVAAAWLARA